MTKLDVQKDDDPTLELTDEDVAKLRIVESLRNRYKAIIEPNELEMLELSSKVQLTKGLTGFRYRAKINGSVVTETMAFRNKKNGRPDFNQRGDLLQFKD